MRKFLFIISLLFISLLTFAGKVKFEAKLSHQTVEVGERFQITFSVNTNYKNLIEPDLSKFKVLSGPNQSQSTQIINGNISQNVSISYILVANEVGTYNIEPAKVVVGKEQYKSNGLQLKVVAASQNSANQRRNQQTDRRTAGNKLKNNFFIKAYVDKSSAYVGEKITATYKIYYNQDILDYEPTKAPDLTGFWTSDIDLSNQRGNVENYNGRRYNVSILKKTLLFPQKSGDLIIDPYEMMLVIKVRTNKRSIWGYVYDRKEITVSSEPLKIEVKALPRSGKPANFSGAVGRFDMSMEANKDSVSTNEAIDVLIKITGEGNLPLIGAPELNFPPDFEVYDPDTENNYSSNASGVKGSKSFKYLAIPRHAGNFSIDPYSFSYFDIESKSYKTIESKALELQVGKGDEETNVVYGSNRKEDVEILNTDIRYIHLNTIPLVNTEAFFGSSSFYLIILFIILCLLGLYLYSKKYRNQQADKAGLRKSRANRLARKRLSKAKELLSKQEWTVFYEEISTALYGYYADKFNIPVVDLSQEYIIALLHTKQVEQELENDLKQVLEDAEMARFAANSNVNAENLYNAAVEVISKSEGI